MQINRCREWIIKLPLVKWRIVCPYANPHVIYARTQKRFIGHRLLISEVGTRNNFWGGAAMGKSIKSWICMRQNKKAERKNHWRVKWGCVIPQTRFHSARPVRTYICRRPDWMARPRALEGNKVRGDSNHICAFLGDAQARLPL